MSRMKKGILKGKPKGIGKADFAIIQKAAKKLGLYPFTDEMKEKEKEILDLRQPNIPRVKETKPQVSLRKEIDGYTIEIHTSYNKKKKSFTKRGKVWLLITRPDEKEGSKKLFTAFFYRIGIFAVKTAKVMRFLDEALKNRPLGKNHQRMELKEISCEKHMWVSTDDPQETKSFYHFIPKDIESFIIEWREEKMYYQGRRKKLGIRSRARNLRKKSRVGSPENNARVTR